MQLRKLVWRTLSRATSLVADVDQGHHKLRHLVALEENAGVRQGVLAVVVLGMHVDDPVSVPRRSV